MVKKLIYLDAQQEKRVKQLARKAKTSDSEVIRRAIDAYGRDEAAEVAADTQRVMMHIHESAGGWVDDPADFFHG
jgi:predicted transcriptional regulator